MSERTTGHYEVAVIGGGAAGTSAALSLARARRTVLVADAGHPRNAPAAHVHNYLGREGTPPGELVATGRTEATGYGAEFTPHAVTAARHLDGGGFRLTLDDDTTITATRLLAATGLVDELPDVPGLAPRWGRDVLHCPYCHGWEVRDQAIGVLATGPMAPHQALLWRQWSPRVTLLQHTTPAPTPEDRARLAARGITVEPGEVTGLVIDDDRLTGVTVNGTTVACDALVAAPVFTARTGALTELGLTAEPVQRAGTVIGAQLPVDHTGATRVPGVWAAGNITDVTDNVIGSAAAGARAAAAINADLVEHDTRRALERRTAGQEPDLGERALADRHGR
ncbi:NAD(P)/FAD-dependent oxidoreductase [Saccharopolyspora gloriosae]|uniref:NAD(P)/FAD-dependent oxidoreductase n=1 Tax=Saccharopolyspora gloriosae TaxID=455344 RepID=UPI001FB83B96|nr:NAD(P)/FAD-dependent oxidoreductase [Saccharopolyspora gloriosae]